MRIAVLNRSFSKTGGGAESYSVAIVQALAQRHDMHVFAQETDQPVAGVTYHRVPCISPKPRWLNQWLFALVTWWKTRSGFDVVHSHENTWHGQIQTIHVRTVHYNLFHSPGRWRRLRGWIKTFLSPRLLSYVFLEASRFRNSAQRQIVAASDQLKNECQTIFPSCKLAGWTTVVPGVTLPEQHPGTDRPRALLGLPLGVPLILFVANDYERKGLDTLLQALGTLDSDVHLAIVGHTGQRARYQERVTQMGLSERVHFLGSLTDMTSAYFSANVLAHPSRQDSYGMVVLEAMAHRLPVIVSSAEYCGIASDLTHSDNAFLLANPFDASALAQQLSEALAMDAATRRQLQAQALQFARQHSWQAAALKYEAIYQHAVSLSKS